MDATSRCPHGFMVSRQANMTMSRRVRRLLLPVGAVFLLSLLLSALVGNSAAQPVVLAIDPGKPGNSFALGTIGISLETDELGKKDLNPEDKSLVALMRHLGPGVLRFGGGSVDSSWWTSRDERAPSWSTSDVTPADLLTLRKLLEATGWRVIISVNLGHFDPGRAADEARVASEILGARLVGIAVGNEPDKYSEPVVGLRPEAYDPNDYVNELMAYSTAIRAAMPNIQLYGPDLSSRSPWLRAITSNKAATFAVITSHFYPTSFSIAKGACKGTPEPTADELLSSQTRERENQVLEALLDAGSLLHRPTRISETNTTSSCDYHGGPATSPVFASALWSLDWSLRAASSGVTGINFHGDFGTCAPDTFSPLCVMEASNGTIGPGARPEYYGLVAARELEGGRFVPVDVSTGNQSSDFTSYATLHSHGVITLAIDNFASDGETSLRIDASGYRRASYMRLSAPSLGATADISLGRASFSTSGILSPKQARLAATKDGFRLSLAADSAAIVTLRR